MLLGINPLRLSTAKRNHKPWGVEGGQRGGEVGKVEGRQKDRGEGPGSSRTASQLKTATLPPLYSVTALPISWDPPPQLLLPDLASLLLDSSLWSLVLPSISRSLSLSLF